MARTDTIYTVRGFIGQTFGINAPAYNKSSCQALCFLKLAKFQEAEDVHLAASC